MNHRWLLIAALLATALSGMASRAQTKLNTSEAGGKLNEIRSAQLAHSSETDSSAVRLEAIKVRSERQGTEIEIQVSRPVTPALSTISGPNRLVMDFPNTIAASSTKHIAVDRDGVMAVRIGLHPVHPPVTRVVVDLVRPRNYRVASEGSKLTLKLDESIAADYPPPADANAGIISGSSDSETQTQSPVAAAPSPVHQSNAEVDAEIPQPNPAPPPDPQPANSSTAAPASSAAVAAPIAESAQPNPAGPDYGNSFTSAPATAPSSEPAAPAAVDRGSAKPAGSGDPADVKANSAPAQSTPAPANTHPAATSPAPAQIAAVDARSTSPEVQVPKPPTSAAATGTPSDQYVIGEQDVLAITVWKEPELSGVVVVRPDGKITVPLVNEVKVVGLTPTQLQDLLTEKLKPFVNVPQVTVSVRQINSRNVYLIGQAGREGAFPINSSTTVLQLIAQSGGLKDFAKRKKIYIIRKLGEKQVRYDFNYDDVIRGKNTKQNIILEPGDLVVVP